MARCSSATTTGSPLGSSEHVGGKTGFIREGLAEVLRRRWCLWLPALLLRKAVRHSWLVALPACPVALWYWSLALRCFLAALHFWWATRQRWLTAPGFGAGTWWPPLAALPA